MPKQVWETEDGSVFDTAEEAIRYENECELANKLTYHIKTNCQDACYDSAGQENIAQYILENWHEIKSIVEELNNA